MLSRLSKKWRPETYQGSRNMKQYFEGWYFKFVDGTETRRMAIVPGVSFADASSHAFVQVFDESNASYHYQRYDLKDFRYSRREFEIGIGPNVFHSGGIELHIHRPDQDLDGVITFENAHPWPRRIWSPSAMGAFGLLPGIECYHHVLSLRHDLKGSLSIGDESVDFDGGRGYAEKNWGASFPGSWIWMQTNHFEREALSFVLAAARTKWKGAPVQGLTCGLLTAKHLYQFCTWSGGSIVEISRDHQELYISLQNRRHRLEVVATQSTPTKLPTPHLGAMTGEVLESLSSEVRISLFRRRGESQVMTDNGRHAGMEIGGDLGDVKPNGR